MYKRLLLELRREALNIEERPHKRSSDALLIKMERPNSEKFLRSVTYQGQKLWNELPARVQDLNDRLTFESQILNLIQTEFGTMTNI